MFLDKDKMPLLTAAVAAIICLLLYLPALRCGFVNVDDPDYVLNNPVIRQLDLKTLLQLFFHSHLGWWMPLTWISLAVDYHFWGLNPVGYHLTNIVLHAVNTGLVVLIADMLLRQIDGLSNEDSHAGPAVGIHIGLLYPAILLVTGLFFGAHPLRVESVAWVTERKDVLNGLFAFMSVLMYLHYTVRKGARQSEGGAGIFYVLSLLCFVCSLMAKSVTVVLPAMLLVLDWVPLWRLRNNTLPRLIMEKWPFWLASAVMTICTFLFAAQSQYLVTYEVFPFAQRVVVSGNAIWEYLRLLLFPVGLSPFNVIPDPVPVSYTVKTVLVSIILAGIAFAGKSRLLAACMLCFLLPLLPVLAFFQNGDQSFADRFTYLPSLAPALFLALFCCATLRLARNRSRDRVATVLAVCVITVLMVLTVRQLGVWRSTETFWTRVIHIEPLAISYKERGRYYHGAGRYLDAVADFSAALDRIPPTLTPYAFNFYAFRGESFLAAGRFEEAVQDFSTAISMHPHPAYYYQRGVALKSLGINADADEDFRRAGPEPGPIVWFN
jgi:hypothetical protein